MKISNELDIRMTVASRKIRQFNEAISHLKDLNASENVSQPKQTRDELVAGFDRLKKQVYAFELIS